jgi:hypothetical protein
MQFKHLMLALLQQNAFDLNLVKPVQNKKQNNLKLSSFQFFSL